MTLLAVAVLGAGCGGPPTEPPAPTPRSSTVTEQPSPSPSGTSLTIVVEDGAQASTTWQLTCDPTGGTHPNPTEACRVLAAHGRSALPRVPKDRRCTQVYGGPQRATITGTWQGQQVNSTFSRVNGCEINRWDALSGLLPPVKV